MDAKQKIQQARVHLVLDQPFFGSLILRLPCNPDPSCPTFYTDGSRIGYNPKFVDSLTIQQVEAVLCHEVLHCACGHPWRRDAREHRRWNVAADYAINPILQGAKFDLPKDARLDPQYTGKSAEWIYSQLPPPPPKGKGGSGSGSGQGDPDPGDCGMGEVRDSTVPDSKALEAEWEVAVLQAAAQAQGNTPAGLARRIDEIKNPVVDWKSALRRFVQQSMSRADYSWRQPNRRYISSGLYLPELRSESMPPIVVAIDTSGSIDEGTLSSFAAEVQAIADETRPERIHVIYCDADIAGVDVFEQGEPIIFNPKGGGGTDFTRPFQHAMKEAIMPACFIYLTDMYGTFPKEQPDFPVIWVSTSEGVAAPFGEVIEMRG